MGELSEEEKLNRMPLSPEILANPLLDFPYISTGRSRLAYAIKIIKTMTNKKKKPKSNDSIEQEEFETNHTKDENDRPKHTKRQDQE